MDKEKNKEQRSGYFKGINGRVNTKYISKIEFQFGVVARCLV
jgi:hypothetical protein